MRTVIDRAARNQSVTRTPLAPSRSRRRCVDGCAPALLPINRIRRRQFSGIKQPFAGDGGMTGDGRLPPIALKHSCTVERFRSKSSEWQKPTLSCHSGKISEWQQRRKSRHSRPAIWLVLSARSRRLAHHDKAFRESGKRTVTIHSRPARSAPEQRKQSPHVAGIPGRWFLSVSGSELPSSRYPNASQAKAEKHLGGGFGGVRDDNIERGSSGIRC